MKFSTEQLQFGTSFGLILITLVCLLFALTGCGAQPYARVGVYHQNRYIDVAHTVFKSEVGLEWESTECAWSHLSEIENGSPFNDKDEVLGMDMFGCSVKFGGQ